MPLLPVSSEDFVDPVGPLKMVSKKCNQDYPLPGHDRGLRLGACTLPATELRLRNSVAAKGEAELHGSGTCRVMISGTRKHPLM